jgi:radical SAM superfamily enzyme YgiQ (UPF0313 family)
MWLAYAVGYLEKHGHEVLFIDAPATDVNREELIKRAGEFKPSLAILEASTPSIYNDIEVATALKKALPDCFTILVGVHVSAVPRETLSDAPEGVDAVAVHEYEETVRELAEKLEHSPPTDEMLGSILGIAFRNSRNEIVENPVRPYIKTLDQIPFVSSIYKKHLDITPYFYGHSRHPLVVIVTGRGCPFHCTYCVIPQTMHGHVYRKRSIENVVEEFRYIADNFPEVKEIMIEDDTLTADRKRCRAFARALIEAGATKIPWSANSRADVDLETMKLLKKANCRLFCVGFESGDQEILDNIKKALKLETVREFRKNAKKAGILIHGCFMVGNKGEDKQQNLDTTLNWAKELNPDTAQFYPIMVSPGTEASDYFKQQGWITTTNYRQWITEEGLHSSVVSNPNLSYDELVEFCNRARREFYLRPRYILQKIIQIFTHPGEAKRIFKAFGTFYRYLFS